jgi:O-antigen ligase
MERAPNRAPRRGGATSPLSAARPSVDADTLVRSVLFVLVFLTVWISFHPFPDLSAPPARFAEGGDVVNQVGFSLIFLLLAAWTAYNEPARLTMLLRPVLLATLAWCAISVAASWDPSSALRHLAFTLVIMSISAMALLLPKNLRHFGDLLAIVALIVIVLCYLGVFLVPKLAVHQATDFLEPEHAGDWRGVFDHKNEAGANMVLFIFVGLFVARARSFVLGGVIVVLAAIFLACSESKTAIGILPVALILSAVIARGRSPGLASALVVSALALFNLFSIGTVVFAPIHDLVHAIMSDASFTGRADIWQLGIHAVAQRPFAGYGFDTFFGTDQVLYGLGDDKSWANNATDAHNAYLNLALTIGLPGMALAIGWAVVAPIADYCRPIDDAHAKALQTLFLRVCLYGAFASCFESSIFQQATAVWFFFATSIFGLRYLACTRVAA